MDDYEYGIPDPEYGVFGDNDYDTRTRRTTNADIEREIKTVEAKLKRVEEERTSSDFNRYLIDLYNKR